MSAEPFTDVAWGHLWDQFTYYAAVFGPWALTAAVVYLAVVGTIDVWRDRTIRADLDDGLDWADRQIASLHTRLDHLGAPGVVDYTAHVEAAAATDTVVSQLKTAVGLTEGSTVPQPVVRSGSTAASLVHPDDRPTEVQARSTATRPDFARQPAPPTQEWEPATHRASADRYGRHAAR